MNWRQAFEVEPEKPALPDGGRGLVAIEWQQEPIMEHQGEGNKPYTLPLTIGQTRELQEFFGDKFLGVGSFKLRHIEPGTNGQWRVWGYIKEKEVDAMRSIVDDESGTNLKLI